MPIPTPPRFDAPHTDESLLHPPKVLGFTYAHTHKIHNAAIISCRKFTTLPHAKQQNNQRFPLPGHYFHILLSFAYRQSPQIPLVTIACCSQFATILESTQTGREQSWLGFDLQNFRTCVSWIPQITQGPVKVNENYPEHLARNLGLTWMPYAASGSVCGTVRVSLKCNSVFENLLHKAHSKTMACPFKQTLDWAPAGQGRTLFKIHHWPTLSLGVGGGQREVEASEGWPGFLWLLFIFYFWIY